jgi:hypothetical protein
VSIVRTFTRRCKFDSCPVPPAGWRSVICGIIQALSNAHKPRPVAQPGPFCWPVRRLKGGSGNGPPCDDLRAGGRIITPALLDFGKGQ